MNDFGLPGSSLLMLNAKNGIKSSVNSENNINFNLGP